MSAPSNTEYSNRQIGEGYQAARWLETDKAADFERNFNAQQQAESGEAGATAAGKGSRKKWWIIGAVVLVCVIVAAVVGGVVGSRGSGSHPNSTSSNTSTSANATSSSGKPLATAGGGGASLNLNPTNLNTSLTQVLSTTIPASGANSAVPTVFTSVVPLVVESVTPEIITTVINSKNVTAVGYTVQVTLLDATGGEISEYPTTIVGSTIKSTPTTTSPSQTPTNSENGGNPPIQTAGSGPSTNFITSTRASTSLSQGNGGLQVPITSLQTVVGYETQSPGQPSSTFVVVSTITQAPAANPAGGGGGDGGVIPGSRR
ncbi:hypothetical protein T439DRAFT_322332 [Meredithblackwellia eburnea MCA 4105]